MDNSSTGRKLLTSMNVKLQTTFTFSLVALVTVRHCAGWAATKAAAIQPQVSSPSCRPGGRKQLLSAGWAAVRKTKTRLITTSHQLSVHLGETGVVDVNIWQCAPHYLPQTRKLCSAGEQLSEFTCWCSRSTKPMVNIWVNLLVNPWCSRTTSKPDCQACTRGRAAFTFLSVDRFLYIQTLRALTFNHRKKTEQQKKSMWHHKRNPSWRLLVFSARPACPCMCPSSVLLCCNSCKKQKNNAI